MDYKERYEQALKRAKEIKSKIFSSHLSTESCKAISEYIDEIILEPRESEDERIRKKMIEHFKSKTKETWCNMPVKSILDYLEKQKEQEEIPLMNGDADLYFDNWIQHNDTTKRGCFEEGMRYAQRLQKEQKPISQEDFDAAKHEATFGEQKPVEHHWEQMEWVDIDFDEFTENVRHLIIDKLTTSIPSVGGGKLTSTVFIDDKTAKEIANGILFFIGPQKLVEWTKEDKDFMDIVIARIFESPNITTILAPNECYKFNKALTKIRNKMDLMVSSKGQKPTLVDKLRSVSTPAEENWFEIQKKWEKEDEQKPVEWSEEDEHRITDAIYFLETAKSHYADTSELDATINFLKSLRPPFKDREMKLRILKYLSTRCNVNEFEEVEEYLNNLRSDWKPSEEQMEALESAMKLYKDTHFEIHHKKIVSLYEQLKKLM